MATVKDFYEHINKLAPFKTSYSWDNSGLLIGDSQRVVKKVLFTLDVTDRIVNYAISNNVDLIISHHPLFMHQGLKSITQKKILNLIENKIALISAHTNLDVSKHGVNFVLAETIGLKDIKPLSMLNELTQYQITVYTTIENAPSLLKAMNEAGSGNIGNYSDCGTYYEVFGQYKPLEASKPYNGRINVIENIKEVKIEVFCEEIYLNNVLNVMLKNHPYETPVYYVIPLKQSSPNYGIGCYGTLSEHISLNDLAILTRNKLNAPFLKLWLAGLKEEHQVNKVAVCGGSGNTYINEAKQKADVYISSDFNYHQLLDAPMPVIDAGHFFTENPVMRRLMDTFECFECEKLLLDYNEHDIANLKCL